MNFETQLLELISQNLDVDKEKITSETDFYTDLNASRLEVADLLQACQQKFNLNLGEEAIHEVKTVADLLKILEETSDEL